MRPYPQQYERDWHHDDPSSPCVMCGSELGLPLQVGGHYGVRELAVCRRCEDDHEALVALVDDLHVSDTRPERKRSGEPECPQCLSPSCDCDRVTVLGDYWLAGHERRERA